MTTIIDFDAALADKAFNALGGEAGPLTPLIEQTLAARGSGEVVWRMPVDRRSVHCLESIHRLGALAGATVDFVASDALDAQERAFFDDYMAYRLPIAPAARRARKAAEWIEAGREAFDALIRLRPGEVGPGAEMPDRIDTAVIIGVYGGDHIGDAAILGGAILDLHRRYGLRRATVMSARPEHTRRLVEGLSVPVEIEVERYRAAAVERRLKEAQALVLGGGPLFASPRILARHLASAEAARRRGIPFLIERIGVVALEDKLCVWAARRIARMASRISVRSEASARHRVMAGLRVEVSPDPAFDSLASRTDLDRLPAADAAAIDDLLADTDGALTVGLNLRPTHDDWLSLPDLDDPQVDPELLAGLCRALVAFAEANERPVTYVYFPMNAIQLGMSDLTAACALRRVLPATVDLRVWQGDPSLDGVLHLLRQLDAVVAMRFHAAIFAESQGNAPIGIEFFPPPGGKITQLFAELGRPQDASTVAAFSSEWLVDRLHARALGAARAAEAGQPRRQPPRLAAVKELRRRPQDVVEDKSPRETIQ